MAGSATAVLWRHAVVAVAVALGATVVLAAAVALADAVAREWIVAGYWRLVGVLAWDRFIHLLPITGPVALALVSLLALLRRRRARVPDVAGPALVRTALATFALLAALGVAAALDRWRTAAGPSLVLISIDTLRADRLGAYGYALPTSPTLDARLAREGTLFDDVYSQSPKTTPSHMTLFTS